MILEWWRGLDRSRREIKRDRNVIRRTEVQAGFGRDLILVVRRN